MENLDTLPWTSVASSVVSEVAFLPSNDALYVRFASTGATYRYDDATLAHFYALVRAASPGKYVNTVLKNECHYEQV